MDMEFKVGEFIRVLSVEEIEKKFQCHKGQRISTGVSFVNGMWDFCGWIAKIAKIHENWKGQNVTLHFVGKPEWYGDEYVYDENYVEKIPQEEIKKMILKNNIPLELYFVVRDLYGQEQYKFGQRFARPLPDIVQKFYEEEDA